MTRIQATSRWFAAFLLMASSTATAGLSASPSQNSGTYTVSWSAISNASSYVLYESTNGGASWSATYAADLTLKSFAGKPSQTYTYKLKYCKERLIGGEWVEICTHESGFPYINVDVNGIAVPPSEMYPASAIGSTPYAVDVGTDGDTVINIPLDLIPGVEGFAPTLALLYDSGRGVDRLEQSLPEDTLGYGWRLAGLSQIRRCVVNQPAGASITLSPGDSLCLDGMPLLLVSGSHLAVGAIYRTLIESYIQIEAKGSAGALWFEASMPDGSVREYGTSKAVDQSGGVDYQWSLDRDTSADGNVVDYTYWFDAANGINYPVGISYADAEVKFEYLERNDTGPVPIGSASQTQTVFLHTITVKFKGKKVREYRLLDQVVSGRRRLHKVQQCGYDEAGTTAACLPALAFFWMTPDPTMAGVPILVDGLQDGLGNISQIEYGTITGSSHPFLFTERPFGTGVLPPDTQLLTGGGALRHVATKLRRDNGLGGFHDTSYEYQNKGVESTKHWGFLGFYAQKITDEQSGLVTYVQSRLDYPYFSRVSRIHQFDADYGLHSEMLIKSEAAFTQEIINHAPEETVYPYESARIDFLFEGSTQLGASQTTTTINFTGGFADDVTQTSETGTSVTTGASGSTWGEIPQYTIGNILNTTRITGTGTYRDNLEAINWDRHRPGQCGAITGTGTYRDNLDENVFAY